MKLEKRGEKRERKKIFNQIIEDIASVKIQGAQNVARNALYAYSLIPTKKSKKKLLSLRPTEPLMKNILDKIENKKHPYSEIMMHFKLAQNEINKHAFKIIKNKDVLFTHCHSSTVTNALINAKKKGKKFEVYVTETRPLFQGKKTAKELSEADIPTSLFVDSAAMIALTKNQGTKKVDKFFIGADALLEKGILNKVGSGMFSKIAFENEIPIYVLSDSWKYTKEKVKIEKRSWREIWKKPPETLKIKNPSFEFVPKKYLKGIISEYGLLSYEEFVERFKESKND